MISAIDQQQSIMQAKIIERIQQVQQQHPDMQQQYFEIQLSQERHKMMKKINESEDMYRIKESEEEGEKRKKDQQKRHETAEPDIDGEASTDQEQHGHIDIKV